jgi:sporulation protein YlmC with PRC-barrel domain
MKATMAMTLFGAVLISIPATAQTMRPADQAPKATQQTNETKAPPLYEMKTGQWRATKLEGLDVYNPNNEKIGDVSELIIDRDGKIEAVVIGVGGFLGMGEHQVAVPFEQVQWIDQPRERAVSSNAPGATPTTGSSTAPAPAAGTDRANRPAGTTAATDGAVGTTTTTDRQTGATVTTTDRPAGTTTMDRPAGTTAMDRPATATTADRSGAREAYRGYPDHAVVAMTKDQLKALPEVRYAK